MTHHPVGDIHLRHKHLPDGFTRYKNGQGCPADVEPQMYVELMVRTAEGFGCSGLRRGWLVDWDMGHKKGGLGSVAGYRIVQIRA